MSGMVQVSPECVRIGNAATFYTNLPERDGIQAIISNTEIMLDKEETLKLIDRLLSYWEE